MPPNWDGFSIRQSALVGFHRHNLFALVRLSHAISPPLLARMLNGSNIEFLKLIR